jgi:hypothetical protein
VLELQAVTPDGEIRIANPNQNQDLFWALRGGGGSTYGVVTRVSYKAYPEVPVLFLALYMTPKGKSAADLEAWYNGMAYYFAMQPNFTDFGLSGYPSMTKDSYSGMLMVIGKTEKELKDWFGPIGKKMESYGIVVEPNYITNEQFETISSGQKIGNGGPSEPSGTLFSMSSRLFSRTAMTETNVPNIAKMLKVILNDTGAYLLPYANVPGVSHHNRKWDFGLNPAWKTTAFHMISIWHLEVGDDIGRGKIGEFKRRSRRDGKSPMETLKEMERKMTAEYIPAMDRLAQNHGAYINEVRHNTPKDLALDILIFLRHHPTNRIGKRRSMAEERTMRSFLVSRRSTTLRMCCGVTPASEATSSKRARTGSCIKHRNFIVNVPIQYRFISVYLSVLC